MFNLHSTGFEPVMFQRKTDYESGAFNHSATNANMELMGIEPMGQDWEDDVRVILFVVLRDGVDVSEIR